MSIQAWSWRNGPFLGAADAGPGTAKKQTMGFSTLFWDVSNMFTLGIVRKMMDHLDVDFCFFLDGYLFFMDFWEDLYDFPRGF